MAHLKLTRRRFIQGLGLGVGASFLTPLMRQVWAENMEGVPPKRFVFFVESNGIETTTFMTDVVRDAINAKGGTLDIAKRKNYSQDYRHTSPLEVVHADLGSAFALSPLKGAPGESDLTGRAVALFGISNLVAGGGHTSNFGAMSSSLASGSIPVAPSIDTVLSTYQSVRQQTPFDVLRLGVVPNLERKLQYALLAFGPKKAAPLIVDPVTTHRTLYGSVASASGGVQFERRKDLLSLASEDVHESMNLLPGSSPERAKLETYIESIAQLQERQQRLIEAEDVLRSVDPGGPDVHAAYTDACILNRMEMQCELATSALLGGLTNVAVLTSGGKGAAIGARYESLRALFEKDPNFRDVPTRHTVCHESGSNPVYLEIMHTVTRRHVEMIAKMARTLEGVPEGDGTMLDHTAIVFLSDNGDEHHSTAREWPVLIVGGSKLGIQTGNRAIVYPGLGEDRNRQMSNVFNTMGHAAGVDLNTFGLEGSTRIAEGPLTEIFG